jgi:DNA helicase-2/ATP-dependent DNA helicase PcrA
LENKLKIKVAKSHIYYTSETESNPNISFITDNESVKRTISKFEQIVLNIQDKKYYNRTTDTKICKNCDMRFYCKKNKE